MTKERVHKGIDRRRFLQQAGLTAGAGAVLPLLGSGTAVASPSSSDPDRLFQDGRFKEAERGYRKRLRENSDDAHAAAQIGYIAILSNRFTDAEKFLTRAVTLAPDDTFSLSQLTDCFVRQDRLSDAVPWLRKTGNPNHEASADLYESINGVPWQVHGPDRTRVPMLGLDPLPHLEVSINGGPPKTFLFDTGATTAGFSMEVAREAGLEVVSTSTGNIPGQTFTMYHGIAESVRIGDIEVRNVPVHWNEATRPPLPDGSEPDGVIGTTHFYHFLSTIDYGHKQFVLRRKTHGLRDEAKRHGAVLPLWLAKDHFPLTLGSLNDYGPRVATFDTGGLRRGFDVSLAVAERAGIEVGEQVDDGLEGVRYLIAPERGSLGAAVRRHVTGWASENPMVDDGMKFDTIGNFTHEFFKPFAITLDFAAMNLYITGDSMDPDA